MRRIKATKAQSRIVREAIESGAQDWVLKDISTLPPLLEDLARDCLRNCNWFRDVMLQYADGWMEIEEPVAPEQAASAEKEGE